MKILSTRKLGFLPGGIREDYEVHARGGAARDGVGNCSAKADITDQVIFTVKHHHGEPRKRIARATALRSEQSGTGKYLR